MINLNFVKDSVFPEQQIHFVKFIKTNQFMLCREITPDYTDIHTKHTNILCGQNVELFDVKRGGV